MNVSSPERSQLMHDIVSPDELPFRVSALGFPWGALHGERERCRPIEQTCWKINRFTVFLQDNVVCAFLVLTARNPSPVKSWHYTLLRGHPKVSIKAKRTPLYIHIHIDERSKVVTPPKDKGDHAVTVVIRYNVYPRFSYAE